MLGPVQCLMLEPSRCLLFWALELQGLCLLIHSPLSFEALRIQGCSEGSCSSEASGCSVFCGKADGSSQLLHGSDVNICVGLNSYRF